MPFSYGTIKREVALKTAQLSGSNQAQLQTAYTNFTLDGAEVPASSFKTVILNTAKELANIIGGLPSNPYRTFLYGQSAPLSALTPVSTPSSDIDGVEFVGVFDSVRDAVNNIPLTEQPPQTIQDINAMGFAEDFYNYNLRGNFIHATRASIVLEGCIWNETAQGIAYDADGTCPLPEMLSNTLIAGAVANMGQVGWTDGANAIPMYESLYQSGIQILKMGGGEMNLPLASQTNMAVG